MSEDFSRMQFTLIHQLGDNGIDRMYWIHILSSNDDNRDSPFPSQIQNCRYVLGCPRQLVSSGLMMSPSLGQLPNQNRTLGLVPLTWRDNRKQQRKPRRAGNNIFANPDAFAAPETFRISLDLDLHEAEVAPTKRTGRTLRFGDRNLKMWLKTSYKKGFKPLCVFIWLLMVIISLFWFLANFQPKLSVYEMGPWVALSRWRHSFL